MKKVFNDLKKAIAEAHEDEIPLILIPPEDFANDLDDEFIDRSLDTPPTDDLALDTPNSDELSMATCTTRPSEVGLLVLGTLRVFHWESALLKDTTSYTVHTVLGTLYDTLSPLIDTLVEITANENSLGNVENIYALPHYVKEDLLGYFETWIERFSSMFSESEECGTNSDAISIRDEITTELRKAVYLLSGIL